MISCGAEIDALVTALYLLFVIANVLY
jgi:hypothetical protein